MAKKELQRSLITQHWVPPVITAVVGLFAGMLLASYNSEISTNRFFLEKRAKTADDIAFEFTRYVENWGRLIRVRKQLDEKRVSASNEEREYFAKIVVARTDARDKLFSAFDALHLYYGTDVSDLVIQFKSWDRQQAELTVDMLPLIDEWRTWQTKILRQLHKEILR
jgi:hypothetical protein